MLYRWTVWEDEQGDAHQLSLALLDRFWEPQVEFTKAVGPFHSVEDRRHELLDDARRWLATYGIQEELQA